MFKQQSIEGNRLNVFFNFKKESVQLFLFFLGYPWKLCCKNYFKNKVEHYAIKIGE